jgi:hypothetical protein
VIFLIQNYQDFLLAEFWEVFGRSFAYYLPNGRSVRYVSSIVVVPETQNCTGFVRGGAKLYWICPILRLVPPPHGRGGAPMVGGVRPSWCPRAMGEFAASAELRKWTNLAVSRAIWAVSVVLHEIIAVTDVI